MATEKFINSPTPGSPQPWGTITAPCGTGDTTLTVTAPVAALMGPTSAGYQLRIILDQEIMLATGSDATNQLTVLRGASVTGETVTPTAATHNSGTQVFVEPTAGSLGGQADAAVGTPSLRSIGTGAQQAAQGSALASEITTARANEAAAAQRANNASDFASIGITRYNLHEPVLTAVATVATANVASLSGLQTINAYTLVDGDHILLTAQTTASQNGPWVAHAGAWLRPATYSSTTGPIGGSTVGSRSVASTQDGTLWTLQTNASITVDTTATTWVKATGSGITVTGFSTGQGIIYNGSGWVGQNYIAPPTGLTANDLLVGTSGGAVSRLGVGSAGQSFHVRSDGTVGWVSRRISLRAWGAVGGNAGTALSAKYGSLAAAQVDYPFATSLTQTLDYCATQAALTAAGNLTWGGAVEVPGDEYVMSSAASVAAGASSQLTFPTRSTFAPAALIGDGEASSMFKWPVDTGAGTWAVRRNDTTPGQNIFSCFFQGPKNATIARADFWTIASGSSGAFTITYAGNTTSSLTGSGGGSTQAAVQTALRALTPARTDGSAAAASGASVVTDTAVVSGDTGSLVTGTNIPANTLVGTVSSGTSFNLVDAWGRTVVTTGVVSGVTITGGLGNCIVTGTNGLAAPAGGPFMVNVNLPGVGSALTATGTTVTKTNAGSTGQVALMNGIEHNSNHKLFDCSIGWFQYGVVVDGNHNNIERCSVSNNFYGIYYVNNVSSKGNTFMKTCVLTGNAFASIATVHAVSVSGADWIDIHVGFGPLGFYVEPTAGGASSAVFQGLLFSQVSFESCYNSYFYDPGGGSQIINSDFNGCLAAGIMTYQFQGWGIPQRALFDGPTITDTHFIGCDLMWTGVPVYLRSLFFLQGSASHQRVTFDNGGVITSTMATTGVPYITNSAGTSVNTPGVVFRGPQTTSDLWRCTPLGTIIGAGILVAETSNGLFTAYTGSGNIIGITSSPTTSLCNEAPVVTRGPVTAQSIVGFTFNQPVVPDPANPGYLINASTTVPGPIVGWAVGTAAASGSATVDVGRGIVGGGANIAQVATSGTVVTTPRPTVNLKAGAGVTLTPADNSGMNATDVTIAASGITVQANGTTQAIEPILDILPGASGYVTVVGADDPGNTRTKVTIDLSTGAQNALVGAASGVFGDGSDGAITFDGTTAHAGYSSLAASTYTLTRDVQGTTIVVNSGVTIKTAGYRVFANVSLSNAGTIDNSGGSAAATVVGTAAGNGIFGVNVGTASGTGNGVTGAGGGIGVGNGGAGGAGGTGSASGTSFSTNGSTGVYHTPFAALNGIFAFAGASQVLKGGPSGGAGGGDGTNKGGAGGCGGGVVVIISPSVTNTGTISATGGAGGTPTVGNAGGGGGGAAGLILVYTTAAWTAGTTVVTGGAAGALAGTGANGVAGAAGTVLNVIL